MTRRFDAAVAAALLAMVAALLAPAAPAAAATTITATPATDLLDRQPVTVTASELEHWRTYVIVDCAVGVGCTPGAAYWRTIGTIAMPLSGMYDPRRVVRPDADGNVAVTTKVRRDVQVQGPGGDPTVVDCSTHACALGIVSINNSDTEPDDPPLATTPLTFQPTGSYVYPAATATVTPRGPLRHRALVDVDATGFDPDYVHRPWPFLEDHHVAFATTCGAEWTTECQWQPGLGTLQSLDPDEIVALQPDRVDVADDGSVDDIVPINRFLRTGPSGDFIDCAQSPCTMVLYQPGQARSTPVPLDVGPEWAPWPSAEAMVSGLDDLVGEGQADEGREGTLRAQLAGDGEQGSVQNLIWWLASEAPVAGTVATLYSALVPTRPDTAGLRYWIERLETGTPRSRMANAFANTPAVRATHASLDDSTFVEVAYTTILRRPSDPTGRQYWLDRLATGMPRYRLLASFGLTPEAYGVTRNRRIMAATTLGLRGRAPTSAEWAASHPVSGNGEKTADRIFSVVAVADAFRTSPQ